MAVEEEVVAATGVVVMAEAAAVAGLDRPEPAVMAETTPAPAAAPMWTGSTTEHLHRIYRWSRK